MIDHAESDDVAERPKHYEARFSGEGEGRNETNFVWEHGEECHHWKKANTSAEGHMKSQLKFK
jgi:hypothetical protein